MKIDSLQFALYVQAILQDAEKGDQLAMQTLTEWDEMNQEEGLPPMKEQLTEWNKANAPQRSTTDVQPLTQPTTMAKTFKEETNERCEQWERENGRSLKSLSREEWISAMEQILCCPRFEVEQMLDNMLASRL